MKKKIKKKVDAKQKKPKRGRGTMRINFSEGFPFLKDCFFPFCFFLSFSFLICLLPGKDFANKQERGEYISSEICGRGKIQMERRKKENKRKKIQEEIQNLLSACQCCDGERARGGGA